MIRTPDGQPLIVLDRTGRTFTAIHPGDATLWHWTWPVGEPTEPVELVDDIVAGAGLPAGPAKAWWVLTHPSRHEQLAVWITMTPEAHDVANELMRDGHSVPDALEAGRRLA